jgi:(1->4)-alpha-D-glucan 1-alpha-D-glucosylmutase
VIKELFAGETNSLTHQLIALAEHDRHARDIPAKELRDAFISVTANLPVYRTYIRQEPVSETDRAHIEDTLAVSGSGPAFDFLKRVLLIEPAWYIRQRKGDYLEFVMQWQQFTGPVMAKGLEDTAFYVYNPLISMNEVGGDSTGDEGGFGIEEFHRQNLQRRNRWPHTMNATSTHDTKRSEDVRARINVLSEMPDAWKRCLRRWSRLAPTEDGPARNEQVLIYQTMLGAWPIEIERLKQYVTKALREGKTNTSWINTNECYEQRVLSFVESLYSNEVFLKEFLRLQRKVAFFGSLASLSQLVLKITSPGIPDFYQGAEVWDLSLADPDNRRRVDFDSRRSILSKLDDGVPLRRLLKSWPDGRIKMYLTSKLLQFRRAHRALFSDGEYIPLRVNGPFSNHIIAFARRLNDEWCIVAVPRLCASLTRTGSPPVGKVWQDTEIEIPKDAPSSGSDIFTGKSVGSKLLADLFGTLPISVVSMQK